MNFKVHSDKYRSVRLSRQILASIQDFNIIRSFPHRSFRQWQPTVKSLVSWTVANGTLGWTVGGYNVGVATVSGGPYTFTSVGNVTRKTVTSLTDGTTYYFVVQALDALGNVITTSGEVSAIPVSSSPPPSICTDHSATNYGGPLPCMYSVPSGGGGEVAGVAEVRHKEARPA